MAPHWDSFPMPALSLLPFGSSMVPRALPQCRRHSAQPQLRLLNPKAPIEGTQRTVMFPKAMGRAWSS